MYKILPLLALLLILTGCGVSASSNKSPSDSETSTNYKNPNISKEEKLDGETSSDFSVSGQEDMMENKILIAYFSATGTTKQVAEQVSDILKADLYEIIPEVPYTEEDLAYYTGGRADQEQDDYSVRPAILGEVETMDQYDTILLGYPIWHEQASRIIGTFLESYDFSGKTIIPFCTSHSSGMRSSASNLHALCSEKTLWMEGRRFSVNTTKDEIKEWLQSLDK